jgi:hypothetical protein
VEKEKKKTQIYNLNQKTTCSTITIENGNGCLQPAASSLIWALVGLIDHLVRIVD